MDIPIIGSGKESSEPLMKFAKKEDVVVPVSVMREMSVQIPPIYYWEEVIDGVSVLMTMAFEWKGRKFGMSYPLDGETNVVKIDIMRKKLFGTVRESLDVLVHHGEKVLDVFNNIDPRLVNDEEALRWRFDPYWEKKVAAFNKLVKIYPITKGKAIQLGLLPQPKKLI